LKELIEQVALDDEKEYLSKELGMRFAEKEGKRKKDKEQGLNPKSEELIAEMPSHLDNWNFKE